MSSPAPEFPDLKLPEAAAIGVFGHYGNENMGDEAIIEAVFAQIRQRLPAAQLSGFSLNPRDTTERLGVPAWPIRRGLDLRRIGDRSEENAVAQAAETTSPDSGGGLKSLLKSLPLLPGLVRGLRAAPGACADFFAELRFLATAFAQVRRLDLLMITGSNQFLDKFGGAWGFPYTLLKWTCLARLAGTPVVFVSVGAGPLEGRLALWMIRRATGLANYVSVRDEPSRELLQANGCRSDIPVFPDLAFGLPGQLAARALKPAGESRIVGINPMPVYDRRYWFEHDDQRYRAYVEELTRIGTGLLDAGHQLRFFSTQPRDELVIEDVMASLESRLGRRLDRDAMVVAPRTVQALVALLQQLDLTVATRFHGVVLSLWAGLPTVSICYYRKQNALMESMGQGEFAVRFEDLEAETVVDFCRRLDGDSISVRSEIESSVRHARRALAEQFDGLFGPVQRTDDLPDSAAQWHGS